MLFWIKSRRDLRWTQHLPELSFIPKWKLEVSCDYSKDHREKSVSSLFQKRIHIQVVKMRDTKMIKRMKNMTNNIGRATSLDREKIVGQVVWRPIKIVRILSSMKKRKKFTINTWQENQLKLGLMTTRKWVIDLS